MPTYALAPIRPPDAPDDDARADWPGARPVTPVPMTETQRRIYDYIWQHQQMRGVTPSYREIAAGCRLRSVSTVRRHIERLVELGMACKPPCLPRAIALNPVPVKWT